MPRSIAIVGRGITGLSIAFEIARQSHDTKVVVYGAPQPAGDADGTWAAPAMVNVFAEVTARTRQSPAGRHLLDIGVTASRMWPEFAARINEGLEGLGVSPIDVFEGTYVLARPGKADERRNLQAVREALADYGLDYEEVACTPRNGTAPNDNRMLRSGAFDEGIHIPFEKFVEAEQVLAALEAVLAARSNVTLRGHRVVALEDGGKTVVDDAGDRLKAEAVVLANGCGFNELAAPLGIEGLPYLLPVYGVGMTLPIRSETPVVVRTPVYGGSCGDYAIYFPNHVYVGASALANSDKVEITTHLQRNLEFFDQDAPITGLSLKGGTRAMSQDTYPLIGQFAEGVWAATGLFRSGITFAPYVADLIAKEVTGAVHDYDNLFLPRRHFDQDAPPMSDLVATIVREISDSATSSGSRRAYERYRWLVKMLVYRNVWSISRKFPKGFYLNSDIVQACHANADTISILNRRFRESERHRAVPADRQNSAR